MLTLRRRRLTPEARVLQKKLSCRRSGRTAKSAAVQQDPRLAAQSGLPGSSANQGGRQQRDASADDGSLVDKAGADHADELSARDAGSERGTF